MICFEIIIPAQRGGNFALSNSAPKMVIFSQDWYVSTFVCFQRHFACHDKGHHVSHLACMPRMANPYPTLHHGALITFVWL